MLENNVNIWQSYYEQIEGMYFESQSILIVCHRVIYV